MAQGLTLTLVLACSLTLGPLISTSHHATSKTYKDLRATLDWSSELRWQEPDDGGPRYKGSLFGSAYVRITAPGMTPQVLSLAPFLPEGHAYTAVDGPSDGCGAVTNLAILPKARSPLPYVVAFVVLAEKGCLALPIVFVPLHSGDRYAYVGAPYYATWWSGPRATSRIRAASIDNVSLPSRSALGAVVHNEWTVIVVTNALSTGPRVAVFEPPNRPKQIRLDSTIMLGDVTAPGSLASHRKSAASHLVAERRVTGAWPVIEKSLDANAPRLFFKMATQKGLEPSTSAVTGRRSNQLSYCAIADYGPVRDSRPLLALAAARPFSRNGGHGWDRTNDPPRVKRMLSH